MVDGDISDTSTEIAARQRALRRRASVAERAQMIDELSETTTAIALAGIDRQHPHADASERARLLAARRYGRAFVETGLGRMLAT